MAHRSDIVGEVAQASKEASEADPGGRLGPVSPHTTTTDLTAVRRQRQQAHRVRILSLKLAGVSTEQIAEQMGVDPRAVRLMVQQTLRTAENRVVDEMRELENSRLDRAQAAIWSAVLQGDLQSVMVFLQISARRAKLNGLDAPTSLVISPNVRQEMERALTELQELMPSEVAPDDGY